MVFYRRGLTEEENLLRSHVKLVAKSQFISSCWTPGLLHFDVLSYPVSDIRLTLGPVALSKVEVGTIPH